MESALTREILLANGRRVGDGQPCFIIAEIGQNHQGDIETAKTMIRKAKECGADCVKFQKTCIEAKFTPSALAKPYTSPHAWGRTYGEHKQYLEFSEEQYTQLQQCATDEDIMLTASAMDEVSLEFLHSLKVPFIKIGSGDSNNIPLIKKAASLNKPLFISTGMLSSIKDIDSIYCTVTSAHRNFTLLHCVSSYPTPYGEINLRVIPELRARYPGIPIGYSGHETGIEVCVAAVALGAKIIERHFTLDKQQKGSDHASSLSPAEFAALVTSIRNVEQSMGSPEKTFQPSEMACYSKLGKSLVAMVKLREGIVLEEKHLVVKVAEPKGMDGGAYKDVLGRKLKTDLEKDDSLQAEYLE